MIGRVPAEAAGDRLDDDCASEVLCRASREAQQAAADLGRLADTPRRCATCHRSSPPRKPRPLGASSPTAYPSSRKLAPRSPLVACGRETTRYAMEVRRRGNRLDGAKAATAPSTSASSPASRQKNKLLATPKATNSSQLDDTDRLIQGVFEPPNGFVLSAIARRKWVVGICTVLLAVIGIVYGLSRPNTYTASATLQVGQVNPNSPGFNGYLQSATALSTAFSRSINAEQVLDTVQHKLKVSRSRATERLSAEAIPTSPAFRVIATGRTELAAVQLANVAAAAVVAYENQSNSTNPEATSLLHEYQAAALNLRRAVANVIRRSHGKQLYSNALATAEAERNAAAVKLKALGVAYTDAISSRAPSTGLVSLIAGAADASSDHKSTVEKFGLIGLLVGIVLGCIVAILLERRRTKPSCARGIKAETQKTQQA